MFEELKELELLEIDGGCWRCKHPSLKHQVYIHDELANPRP